MYELIVIIFLSMVFAQVWVILLQADMLFDFIGPYIDRIKSEKIRHMFQCSMCMSGQFALWLYLFHMEQYNFFHHIVCIALSIWVTMIVNKFLNE